MLPKEFSATGDYEEWQRDHTLGFRVLAHAEIESYLEELAVKVLTDSLAAWTATQQPNHVMVSFLASYHSGWIREDGEKNPFSASSRTKPKERFLEAVNCALGQYKETIINGNNGIKTANLRSIFVPIGVDFTSGAGQVDQTWLNSMTAFGTKRGLSAHKSRRVHKQIDPKNEFDEVNNVIRGLRKFDSLVMSIKAGLPIVDDRSTYKHLTFIIPRWLRLFTWNKK